jgi:hypothetical protein
MAKEKISNDKTSVISDSAFVSYIFGTANRESQSAVLTSHQIKFKKKISDYCRKYDIKKMSLFGSFAKGTAGKENDIDILIEFYKSREKSLLTLVQMENELGEIFGKKVDLVTFNSLHQLLKREIMNTSKVIYEK